ncbi:DUF2905 domain-containing protein [Methyloglobulus sp.]|uniref:DUF2905 domain-containing protein n=1 Tax=Methyloglobulus sp. TaxID=2518622 RepID=UPI00398940CF
MTVLGIALVIIGLAVNYAPWLINWFGKLPGDIRIQTKQPPASAGGCLVTISMRPKLGEESGIFFRDAQWRKFLYTQGIKARSYAGSTVGFEEEQIRKCIRNQEQLEGQDHEDNGGVLINR